MVTFPVVYAVGVALVGLGTGLWLHSRLQNSHQLSFKFPSPFRAIPTHLEWVSQERHGHASAV